MSNPLLFIHLNPNQNSIVFPTLGANSYEGVLLVPFKTHPTVISSRLTQFTFHSDSVLSIRHTFELCKSHLQKGRPHIVITLPQHENTLFFETLQEEREYVTAIQKTLLPLPLLLEELYRSEWIPESSLSLLLPIKEPQDSLNLGGRGQTIYLFSQLFREHSWLRNKGSGYLYHESLDAFEELLKEVVYPSDSERESGWYQQIERRTGKWVLKKKPILVY